MAFLSSSERENSTDSGSRASDWSPRHCRSNTCTTGSGRMRLSLLLPWISHLEPSLDAPQRVSNADTLEDKLEWRTPAGDPGLTIATGCSMIFLAAVFVAVQLYAMCISKLMPNLDIWWLDAIKEDWNYCVFLPIGFGTSALFVYWNWVALKKEEFSSRIPYLSLSLLLAQSPNRCPYFPYPSKTWAGYQHCRELAVQEIEKPQLACLLSSILRYRLLQDGEWIHSGDSRQHMLDSCVLAQDPGELHTRSYVNCPAFSFGVRVSTVNVLPAKGGIKVHGQVRLMPFVYRVLPLRKHEERGRGVYCLPRLAAPATLQSQQEEPFRNSPLKAAEDFKTFWLRVSLHARDLVALRAFTCIAACEILHTSRLTITLPPGLTPRAPTHLQGTFLPALLVPPESGESSAALELQTAPTDATFEKLNELAKSPREADPPDRLLPPPCLVCRVKTAEVAKTAPKTSARLSESPGDSLTNVLRTEDEEDFENKAEEEASKGEGTKATETETRVLPPPATGSEASQRPAAGETHTHKKGTGIVAKKRKAHSLQPVQRRLLQAQQGRAVKQPQTLQEILLSDDASPSAPTVPAVTARAEKLPPAAACPSKKKRKRPALQP
ncbi:hypothetical protein cyc_08402 [Cyclospora cayetanensis]|uniref:Transmembrane protein n=1 Tax=Cyclospora cayetanensis TaxID=88456 RepID=A0A1D3D2I0_9EIME|nr:hypothetical protein cyc_08402 [Cyclospora cayetanensis]